MSEHSTTLAVTKDEEEFAVVATLSPLESDKQLFAICIVRRVSSSAAARLQDEA